MPGVGPLGSVNVLTRPSEAIWVKVPPDAPGARYTLIPTGTHGPAVGSTTPQVSVTDVDVLGCAARLNGGGGSDVHAVGVGDAVGDDVAVGVGAAIARS